MSRRLLPAFVVALAATYPACSETGKSGDDARAFDGGAAVSAQLFEAVYTEDRALVQSLLDSGHDVGAANDLGATPLWLACQSGNDAIANDLLAAGADPNAALITGETPLLAASDTGNHALVRALLTAGAVVDAPGPRGQTALMWAAAAGHTEVLETLVEAGADVSLESALIESHVAVAPDFLPATRRVIQRGGLTALLFAVRGGHVEAARALIEAGANVNDENGWGVSALGYAAHMADTNMIELLLDRGANVNARRAGFTPLHAVIMARNEKATRLLLDRGADHRIPVTGWTHARRKSQDRHFPPALIGATPMWLAAHTAQPDVMRELARRGADPTFIHRPRFPLQSMQVQEHAITVAMAPLWRAWDLPIVPWYSLPIDEEMRLADQAVRVAEELGADINQTDLRGRTVLNAAQHMQLSSLVDHLVTKGAELKSPTKAQQRPPTSMRGPRR